MKKSEYTPKEKISKEDPKYFDQATVKAGMDMQEFLIGIVILIVIVFVVLVLNVVLSKKSV